MAWLEACALACELVRTGKWNHALCLLLMYDLYLRPGEAFSLTVGSAAPPVREGGRSMQYWAFTIRPFEEGMPAKTGSFDDSVVLDHPERVFLGPLVAAVRQGRRATDPLFEGVDARSFNKHFREAARCLQLDVVPYQARHGGASGGRADRFRSLDEVRKRGRWRSEASTRRYEKHGKLQAKLAAMPDKMRRHMGDVAQHIEAIMRLTRRAPPAPIV